MDLKIVNRREFGPLHLPERLLFYEQLSNIDMKSLTDFKDLYKQWKKLNVIVKEYNG